MALVPFSSQVLYILQRFGLGPRSERICIVYIKLMYIQQSLVFEDPFESFSLRIFTASFV